MHLHRWDIFYDLKYDELDYQVKRIYRRCYTCTKWQLKKSGYMEDWWADSYVPEGVEDLIYNTKAHEIMKDIEMRRNARRIE